MSLNNVKKTLPRVITIAVLTVLLSACAEQDAYEQAVVEQMQNEKDIQDYNIDPKIMAACVVSESSGKMPGLNALDPVRRQALKDYTSMLTLMKSQDPSKELEHLRTAFGSAKGLADAHSNYAEAVVNCMSSLVSKTEEEQQLKN